MTTLEDAWDWYQSARDGAASFRALAGYWDRLPWDTLPPCPARLRQVRAEDLADLGERIAAPLDDLAVLVLFSVFEAVVRGRVGAEVQPEVERLRHPALVRAGEDVLKAIEEGSFFRLLEPFKSAATHDLIEQVNQVRRFRNWVAHGRRSERLPGVMIPPREAYPRLNAFLAAIGPQPAVEPS